MYLPSYAQDKRQASFRFGPTLYRFGSFISQASIVSLCLFVLLNESLSSFKIGSLHKLIFLQSICESVSNSNVEEDLGTDQWH